uniref:NAD(P)H-quinone oxidoreductase subunit 5, chloroplastic n=1 Tax=Chlorokybus atmophyticus TaxID=3144 RepID=NU5C_CHLAT|nr:NADH dehydrogenase subunit 5 [Chlorokybus atmophyticus]Q19V60.2 RecName: Full=NAD(P)H-quinone oxidoreductase subunit 5, chloroplastic; AltName: Full=NAD(P)H dehydrogenase subunit 5; AltName: Full=NADH-plastoquinone oxidoreductase subunit 5 [Chlorokybus atmophyticus]ABD62194.2 subunit 5 of NADH-plastoquinone oxidoreductase [Chlorokybus atmophyticus]
MEFIYRYAWLIPILPFLGSMIIGLGLISLRRATQTLRWRFAFFNIVLLGIALIFSISILISQLNGHPPYKWLIEWIVTNQFSLEIGYSIDPLTSVMLVLVTSVAILVMIYSDSYMSYDQGYVRFFAYLSLFTASMLGLVLSPNLVQIYVFWELVGMCSYLLIGFWFTRPAAADACQKAFVTNRVGDFGLFLGILGLYWVTGSFEFQTISNRLSNVLLGDFVLPGSHPVQVELLVLFNLLVFLGPMAKSAQFPLHVWLPDAMEGPTPISALIHAATMVAAGVFLVARMFPIFNQFPIVMGFIAWIGAITAIIAAIIAVTQNDLKKGLAYSTISQLGYMIMAMGVGSYTAGLFHLITHAYSKALLFLGSGSVIHGMEPVVGFNPSKNQNMLFMGKMREFMPVTAITFLLGTLSLCGIPPMACFWSKDEILSQTFQAQPILWIIAWVTAGLTSFYMFRMYFLVFEGKQFRGGEFIYDVRAKSLPKESNKKILIPLIILALVTTLVGFVGTPFNNMFAKFINLTRLEEHPFEWNEFLSMSGSSVGIALIGLTLASLIYKESKIDANQIANTLTPLYKLSFNKFYIDHIYQIGFIKVNRSLAQKALELDQQIIDGFINFTGFFTIMTGEILKYVENGRVQSYVFVIIFATLIFVLASQGF